MTKRFRLENKLGLHLRPVTLLVNAVQKLDVEIEVRKDEQTANGKSPLELTILAAEPGEELEYRVKGPDAGRALELIEELFASNFGED